MPSPTPAPPNASTPAPPRATPHDTTAHADNNGSVPPNSNNETTNPKTETGTPPAAEWKTRTAQQLPLPLLDHRALLATLHARPEWQHHRVEIKRRRRKTSTDFMMWSAWTPSTAPWNGVPTTYRHRTYTRLEHSSCKLLVNILITKPVVYAHSSVLRNYSYRCARAYFAGGGRPLAGLKLAFSTAKFSSATLPTAAQLSSWLKRQKSSAKTAPSKHDAVISLVQLQLSVIPRTLPDDVATLFLLEDPILSGTEVCVLFSCRGMLHQLSRYQDESLCLTVDTKMKIAQNGYGVATVGLLTKDGLRKTTLSRGSGSQDTRIQGLALTSHTVPIIQAIFHQETDPNYQRLFRRVDRLWQDSATPKRKPLSAPPLQLHKDFKEKSNWPALLVSRCPVAVMIFFIGARSNIRQWPPSVSNLKWKAASGWRKIWIGRWPLLGWFDCFQHCHCCHISGELTLPDSVPKTNLPLQTGSKPTKDPSHTFFSPATNMSLHHWYTSACGLVWKDLFQAVVLAVNVQKLSMPRGKTN